MTRRSGLWLGVWFAFGGLIITACKSTSEKKINRVLLIEQWVKARKSTGGLWLGEVEKGQGARPDYTPVFENLMDEKGEPAGQRLAFKGWDMNHDAMVDMLEELSPEGLVLRRYYDFDADGNLDQVVEVAIEPVPLPVPGPAAAD